jgi:hypothetical protein
MSVIDSCIEKYAEYKNLRLVADDVGLSIGMVYYHLRNADVPVTGDKSRYGTPQDKMARYAEELFMRLVPHAVDKNQEEFQSPYDFDVNSLKVDVKVATKRVNDKTKKNLKYRWAFTTKKQSDIVDYMVLFCMSGYDTEGCGDVEKVLVVPSSAFKGSKSLSVACSGSKYDKYEVPLSDIGSVLI